MVLTILTKRFRLNVIKCLQKSYIEIPRTKDSSFTCKNCVTKECLKFLQILWFMNFLRWHYH